MAPARTPYPRNVAVSSASETPGCSQSTTSDTWSLRKRNRLTRSAAGVNTLPPFIDFDRRVSRGDSWRGQPAERLRQAGSVAGFGDPSTEWAHGTTPEMGSFRTRGKLGCSRVPVTGQRPLMIEPQIQPGGSASAGGSRTVVCCVWMVVRNEWWLWIGTRVPVFPYDGFEGVLSLSSKRTLQRWQ